MSRLQSAEVEFRVAAGFAQADAVQGSIGIDDDRAFAPHCPFSPGFIPHKADNAIFNIVGIIFESFGIMPAFRSFGRNA